MTTDDLPELSAAPSASNKMTPDRAPVAEPNRRDTVDPEGLDDSDGVGEVLAGLLQVWVDNQRRAPNLWPGAAATAPGQHP